MTETTTGASRPPEDLLIPVEVDPEEVSLSPPPETPDATADTSGEAQEDGASSSDSGFFKRVRDRINSALENMGVKKRPEFSAESVEKAKAESGTINEGKLLVEMAGEKIAAGMAADTARAETHQKSLDTKEQFDAQKNASRIIKKALNGRSLTAEEQKVVETIAAGGADQLTLKDLAASILQETKASAEVVLSRGQRADRDWSYEGVQIKQAGETEIEARSYGAEVLAKTTGFEQEKPTPAEVKKLLQETRPLARRQVVAEQMWLRKLSDVSTSLTERFPDQADQHRGNLDAVLQKVAEGKKSADAILNREVDLKIEPQEFHDTMLAQYGESIEEAKKIGELELYLQKIDCRMDENGLIIPEETTPPPDVLLEMQAEKRAAEAWKKVEEIAELAKADSLVADRLIVAIEQFDQLNSQAEIASERFDRTDAWALEKAKSHHEKEVATLENNDAKLQKQLEKENKVGLLERTFGFLSRKLGQVKERIDAKQTARQETRATVVSGLEAQKEQNAVVRTLMSRGLSLEAATKAAADLAAQHAEETAPPATPEPITTAAPESPAEAMVEPAAAVPEPPTPPSP